MSIANVLGQVPSGTIPSSGGITLSGHNVFTGINIFNGAVECNSSLISNELFFTPANEDEYFKTISTSISTIIPASSPLGSCYYMTGSLESNNIILPSSPPLGFMINMIGVVSISVYFKDADGNSVQIYFICPFFGNGMGTALAQNNSLIFSLYWVGSWLGILETGNYL
jgi:hypothetical protein